MYDYTTGLQLLRNIITAVVQRVPHTGGTLGHWLCHESEPAADV